MDEERGIALRIAAAGYMAGNPMAVEEMPIDLALDVYYFLSFQNQFQDSYSELNKPPSK